MSGGTAAVPLARSAATRGKLPAMASPSAPGRSNRVPSTVASAGPSQALADLTPNSGGPAATIGTGSPQSRAVAAPPAPAALTRAPPPMLPAGGGAGKPHGGRATPPAPGCSRGSPPAPTPRPPPPPP